MYYAQLRPSFESTLAQLRASYIADTMTIRDDYSRSSVNVSGSSVSGVGDSAVIQLKPRVQESEIVSGSRWLEPSARVDGVNGFRPTFHFIDYAFGDYHGHPWQSARRPMFSYDRQTWHYFDNATVNASDIEFRHDTAFTSDTVYISRSRQRSVSQVGDWIAGLATSHPSIVTPTDTAAAFTPTLTGWPAQTFIADEFSAQTDELARTIQATPFYAFQINDTSLMPGSGQKRIAVLTTGVHAGEDYTHYGVQEFVDYVLSAATEAQDLRRYYKILIYPMVNAPGNEGGGWRGSFTQGVSGYDDANRHFHQTTSALEIVDIPKAVMEADMNSIAPDWMIDWHGTYATTWGTYLDSGDALQSQFQSRVQTDSGYSVPNFGTPNVGFVSSYFKNTAGAQLGVVIEQGDPAPVSDSQLVIFGQAVATALDSMRSDGLFGSGEIAGSLAATEAGQDSLSSTGAVLVAGLLSAAESGSDVFAATGSQSITGTFAAGEVGADSAVITGSVLIAGSLSATEAATDSLLAYGDIIIQGALSANESGSDTFTATGGDISTGALSAIESGADSFASAGGVVVSGLIGAIESGQDSVNSSGSVLIHGAVAADEAGADAMAAVGGVLVQGSFSAIEEGYDVFDASEVADDILVVLAKRSSNRSYSSRPMQTNSRRP